MRVTRARVGDSIRIDRPSIVRVDSILMDPEHGARIRLAIDDDEKALADTDENQVVSNNQEG